MQSRGKVLNWDVGADCSAALQSQVRSCAHQQKVRAYRESDAINTKQRGDERGLPLPGGTTDTSDDRRAVRRLDELAGSLLHLRQLCAWLLLFQRSNVRQHRLNDLVLDDCLRFLESRTEDCSLCCGSFLLACIVWFDRVFNLLVVDLVVKVGEVRRGVEGRGVWLLKPASERQ